MILGILCFIWGNSLLPGEDSGELSGFVGTLLQTLLPFLNLQSEQGMHLLRKAAHFSEFAALGFSFAWFYGMLSKKRLWSMVLPLVSGAAAAAIDETIQLFSPDRGPSIKDVGIDTAGVITGIAVLTLLHFLYKRMKKR
jgi:VanZ family protein